MSVSTISKPVIRTVNISTSEQNLIEDLETAYSTMQDKTVVIGHIAVSGGGALYIMDRTSSQYGCCLMLSYAWARLYQKYAGEWTRKNFSVT